MEVKVDSHHEELVIIVEKYSEGGVYALQGDDMIYITHDRIEEFIAAVRDVAAHVVIEQEVEDEDEDEQEEWVEEEEEEEGAIDICVDPEDCFLRLDQGRNHIAIMNRDQAKSIAEGLLMLVEEA